MMARSQTVKEKGDSGEKSHISMDPESRERVGESSSTQRSVPKSRNRKSLAASSSPAPRRGAPEKKSRRRKEEETEKVYSLADPGILDQKEEKGKVYYLVNWADDPETGEHYDPTWEPYNFVTPDVVAAWQSRQLPVGGTRAEGQEDSQQRGVIDLTEDSIEDSQPPRPAKRRKITHGPNPTSEEETPEKKPRKVGTVESARFQSVAQEERPNEIKDSYEEDQQLSSAGVGKARVEIPGPQEGFDRDAYSRVITSSQPSQASHTSQLPQSSQPQIFSSSQLQTPAPRHKYSSLIWDEDIEGVIPDSQEPGSSSYKPSTTQVSKSPESTEIHTGADLDTGVGNTQVTSGEDFSPSGTVDSASAEPFFTQASYRDKGVQSSSVQTESSGVQSTDHDHIQTQDSRDNQAQDSRPLERAAVSPDSSAQLGVEQPPLRYSRTSSDSSHPAGVTQASQGQDIGHSTGLPDEVGSAHHSSAHQVVEQTSSPNLQSSLDPSLGLSEARSEERVRPKSPTPLNAILSSPPNLLASQDSLQLHQASTVEYDTTHPHSQPSQSREPEVQESSSIPFGTQVPFQRVEDEDNYLIPSSSSVRSCSVPPPCVSLAKSYSRTQIPQRPTDHPDSPSEQEIEESQALQESFQQQLSSDSTERSTSNLEGGLHAGTASQALVAAPATPVQTPREDIEEGSAETTSVSADPPFLGLRINTQGSPSPSKSQGLPSQRGSGKRSQDSSNSLPSPPFEKAHSSAEQFAQLTSQNRPSTLPERDHRSQSVGETSSQEQPSPPRRSIEDTELQSFKHSQSPQPILQSFAPIQSIRAEQATSTSGSNPSSKVPVVVDLTMDDPPATTPAKPDNPVLAKLKLRKAEAHARKAAERERAASASRSLPQSPAPPSPALQSPALQSPARISPEPAEASPATAAAANDAALAANQALPLQQTIEEVAPAIEPILSPKASPEAEAEPEEELLPTSLRVVSHNREEYAIPLPMVSYARDVYVNAIRTRKSQRYAFLTDEVFDASLVGEIDAMMDELDQLCSHQDLIEEDFSTQRMEVVERQAKWAENVSTKCIFLAEFLSLMQTEPKQIAILVRPGRMLEILEALFTWHGFVYSRGDRPGYTGNTSGGPMKIGLIPTRGEIHGVDPPSIIIAFDSTYTSVPYLKELRTDPTSPNKLIPLLPLIVTHSIEHLEKCFHGNLEPVERKIKLVSCLTQIGDGVGKLGVGYHDPPLAAKAVAEYVVNGTIEGTWPLLPMPDIEDLKLDIDSSQPQQPGFAMSSSNISLAQASQFGMKRQLEMGDDAGRESPKRQRFTPIPGESDPSHISDTVLHTSSRKAPSASAEVSQIMAKTNALDDEQGAQVSALLKKVTDLEIQLRSREATESEFRQINRDLETRCQDYESSIAAIQPKYQEALNDRGEFEHEFNLSNLRQTHLRKELENKVAEVTKLRELKATIEKELIEARAALSSSAIPEIAEMEKLKDDLAKEKSEKERLQKRLANMQGDLEYMRNNYQNSSTLAAEHASENQALQSELAQLREKDKRDVVRIHEIQKNSEVAEYLRRVKELKEENSELERELEKKQDELRAVMNGRRATRGTSVPRSPRMGTGGTMSPNPRPMGRAMQMGNIGMAMQGGNGGSRGNSPAPGDLGGFRGTGTFVGEALFQDNRAPASGVRWGNHLQQ